MRFFKICICFLLGCLISAEVVFSAECGSIYLADRIEYIAPNPPDADDSSSGGDSGGEISGDYGKVIMSSPSSSLSKPEIYVKELKFKDEITKYYEGEDTKIRAIVKNVGVDSSVPVNITVKLYRFEGEKENGDVKEVGKQNIKSENLESGESKEEEFEIEMPDDENFYQFFAVADTEDVVDEADDGNNRLGNIRCRVHKYPDIRIKELALSSGRTRFEPWEIAEARATFTNDGGEPFEDVGVDWILDGIYYATDNIRHDNIESGDDDKHESVNLVALPVGFHSIKVCADCEVDEDAGDNCRELTFEIYEPIGEADQIPDPSAQDPIEIDNLIIDHPVLCESLKDGTKQWEKIPVGIKNEFLEKSLVWGFTIVRHLCCQEANFRWVTYKDGAQVREKITTWEPKGCWEDTYLYTGVEGWVQIGDYDVELYVSMDGGTEILLDIVSFKGVSASESSATESSVSGGGSSGSCFMNSSCFIFSIFD